MIGIIVATALYLYLFIDVYKIFIFLDRSKQITSAQLLEYSDKLSKVWRKTTIFLCIVILLVGFLKIFFSSTTEYASIALFILLFRQMVVCYCIYRLNCFKPKVTGK